MSASFVFVVSWKRETEAAAAGGGKLSRVTVWRPSWNYFLFRFFSESFGNIWGRCEKRNQFIGHAGRFSCKPVSNSFFRFQTEKMFTLSFTRPPPSLNCPPSYNRWQCFTHSWRQDFSSSASEVRASENLWMCSNHTLNFKGWNIKTEKKWFSVSGSFFLRHRSAWIHLLKCYFSYNFHPFEPVALIFPFQLFNTEI